MNLSPVLRQRFEDANGAPLAGGLLYSYQAGTTTPQATYSNVTGTTNTNPVVLDSAGYADVWLDPSLTYKFILKDTGGATIWSVDGVSFAVGITTWNANTVYSQGALALDSSGQGLIYVSLINSNQNNALSNVSAWRVFSGNIRTVTANTTLTVTDDFVRSNSTSGSLTQTLPLCSTTPVGKRITIKDVGTSTNTTSVKGSGTDLVDGNNTYADALKSNGSRTFHNNGTSWDVTGNVTGKQITAAMIADATITTTQIAAAAAILGSQLATNPNFAGTAVQANSRNLLVSAVNSTTNLAVAWAYIPASAGGGSAPTYGQGVSTITQPNTGNYTMQFTTAFASTPVIFALPVANSFGDYVSASSTTGASTTEGRVQICTAAGAAATRDFFFLAVGPR